MRQTKTRSQENQAQEIKNAARKSDRLAISKDKQSDLNKVEAPKTIAENTFKIVPHLGGNPEKSENYLNNITYSAQQGNFTIRPRTQRR